MTCLLSRLAVLIESSQFPSSPVMEEGAVVLQITSGKLYISGHCIKARFFRRQRCHNVISDLLVGLPLWPSRKWRETRSSPKGL